MLHTPCAFSFLGFFEAFYIHKFVVSLPEDDGAVAQRRRQRELFAATLVAFDISEEDSERICLHFNDSWNSVQIVHLCVGNGCPCGGSEEKGKERAKETARLALDRGFSKPLEHRFEGMERAAAWAFRSRILFDLGPRALRRQFSKAAIDSTGRR